SGRACLPVSPPPLRQGIRSSEAALVAADASIQFLFERRIELSNVESAVLLAGFFILQSRECASQRLVDQKVLADSAFEQGLQCHNGIARPPEYFESDAKVEPQRRCLRMRSNAFTEHRDRFLSLPIKNQRRCAAVGNQDVPQVVCL